VEAQTETVWKQANKFNIPRIVFINKLDRDVANVEKCLITLKKKLGAHCVPLQIPLNVGNLFFFSLSTVCQNRLCHQ